MKKQQYKILSKGSSHKGELGYFVSGFQYNGELHYTLKLDKEGFRSYPFRNLEKCKLEVTGKEAIEKFFKILCKEFIKEFKKLN